MTGGTEVKEQVKEPEVKGVTTYDMHVTVEVNRASLKDAALLAYKMGDIPKADIVDLMNLFIK